MLLLRKTTNLIVSPELMLSKSEAQSSFFYFYTKKYVGSPVAFMTKLWLAAIFPDIVKNAGTMTSANLRTLATKLNKIPASYLKIKKITNSSDPHFEICLPLHVLTTSNIIEDSDIFNKLINNLAHGSGVDIEINKQACDFMDRINNNIKLNTRSVISYNLEDLSIPNLDLVTGTQLNKTFIALDVVSEGPLTVIYLILKINARECEQLTATPWLEIRNIDIYPLLLTWVASFYGFKNKAPLTSFPISRIAKTLPTINSNQVRVNEFNVAVTHKGIPLFIPKVLNNTERYEDLFSQAGMLEDGGFSLLTISQAVDLIEFKIDTKTRLPSNIPVLIDWTNNKYSYTLSSGMLAVQDLSRYRPANVTHVVKLLTTQVLKTKMLTQFLVLALAANCESKFSLTSDELLAILDNKEQSFGNSDKIVNLAANNYSIEAYFDIVAKLYSEFFAYKGLGLKTDITMDLIATNSYYILFRPIARFIQAAYVHILDNLDVIYSKYSVSYVSHNLAWITLIAKYGDNLENLKVLDIDKRSPAINQGVDLNWVPDSIPMLGSHVGRLPHQIKVANVLRNSPEFAILPVNTGGGKSMLIIADILIEIKNNRSAPYLIMCPSSLVSQYLKEIVFFTEGKLNAIPITSYTINYNGLDRLTAMISTAPINTVIICSYDVLNYKQQTVCYGTHAQTIYPVIEFLRQFSFGYLAADEVHFLKNKSNRSIASMLLITDIPKKRLASGTMVHDSPSDLAMQIAILDPTLFGSREDFNEKYGQLTKNDRVIYWKPNAQRDIMNVIKSRIVVAAAVRKEWVALLPEVKEMFHRVELTSAQRSVYASILEATLERIKEEAKTNKNLAKFLNPTENTTDEEAESLSSMLTPYLARLEQFITAPSKDPIGDKVLLNADRISPKVVKIIEIIQEHLLNKVPGKILIFTNYVASAQDIYDNLPADLKVQTVLYTALNKVEASSMFETDDNYQIMVGVEQSMNTGINLQFASNLIRPEAVWNPGTEEQGNSRINRPELKSVDRRSNIYFNRIVANMTIDVTKVSRLISKIIAKVKFDNADNNLYAELEDVPIIPMTLDSIQALNNWDEELVNYATVYANYKAIEKVEYAEYKELHGSISLHPISHAPNPEGSMLLAEVPYNPGLELANGDALGLIRLDQFLRMEEVYEDESDNESPDDVVVTGIRRLQDNSARGTLVHTEFGDGAIRVLMNANKVSVDLHSGNRISCKRSAVFVISKPTLITDAVRPQLLNLIGLPVTELTGIVSPLAKLDTVSFKRNAALKELQFIKLQKDKLRNLITVDLQFTTSNGYLGISYFVNNSKAESTLKAMNFRNTPSFKYAAITNLDVLLNQCKVWKLKGLVMDKKLNVGNKLSNNLRDMYNLFNGDLKVTNRLVYNYSKANNISNFYTTELKPSADKNMFKLFSIIEDNVPYLVLPVLGQAGTKTAIKHKVLNMQWRNSEPTVIYFGSITKIYDKIKEIVAAGIIISNLEDLKVEFKKLRKQKFRN